MKFKGLFKLVTTAALSAAIIFSASGVANAVTGTWKEDEKGWWYSYSDNTYAKSKWLEINGHWYYFDASGYMDYSGYREGYWLGSDGAYNSNFKGGKWASNKTGKWYTDASGWYPVSQWLKIDGKYYYFNKDGYAATNQWVGDYYLDKDGVWVENAQRIDYSGKYVETVSGRGVITVEKVNKNYDDYTISVEWSSSASEMNTWSFTGSFDANGTLTYKDGKKAKVTFAADESSTSETIYKDMTGSITIKDGVLTWDDKKENIAKDTKFEKEKTSEETSTDAGIDYSGTYTEKKNGSAYMAIKKNNDGSYSVEISWPREVSEADAKKDIKEYYEWTLSGTFDKDGNLKYENAYKVRAVYQSSDKTTTTPLAKNLSGTITIQKDTLTWVSNNDIFEEDPVFVNNAYEE